MAIQGTQWTRLFAQDSVAGLLLAMALAGCEANNPTLDTAEKPAPSSAEATGTDTASAADARLQQPFAEATRAEPPVDWQRPPDLTLTAKSVGKLYTEVVRLWDTIHFTNKSGKPIAYTALLDTELGPIEIALRPNLAPNHVRNFVA